MKTYARELRKQGVLSEVLLWKYLRSRKMNGYQFIVITIPIIPIGLHEIPSPKYIEKIRGGGQIFPLNKGG
ncbi:MAG: DUF559 domain-containing protein [bacterium]